MNKIFRGAPAAQGWLRAVRGHLAWGGSLGALMWLVAIGVMLPAASARADNPPVGVPDSYGTTEDQILSMDVLANDTDTEDGTPAYLELGSPPAHGTVQVVSGVYGSYDSIEYTPELYFGGTVTFTYFPKDSAGQLGNETTVTLEVTRISPNQAPTAVNDSLSTLSAIDSGGQIAIDVKSNDYDVDGDPITITDATQPANGVVTFDGNVVNYRPNTYYRGTDTFTYTIWDGITAQPGDPQPQHYATATVTVTVLNRAPEPQNPTASTTQGQPVSFGAIVNVPPDPENDSVTITNLGQPANGTAVINGGLGFTYTPNAGFSGTDTFSFTMDDGQGGTAPGLATVTVAANSPPVAANDQASTRSGPTAGLEVGVDVLANDSDPDNDPLTVNVPTLPSNGTLIVPPTGGYLRYTPNPGFSGSEVITYEVSDGINPPVSAVLTINVAADQAPVAADDSATVTAGPGATVQIPVLANDSDPDGDILAYRDLVIVQQPQNGSVTLSCLGACNPPDYQPNPGYTGPDSFTYRAVDALGAQSNVATVNINVTSAANTPPVAVNDDGGTVSNGGSIYLNVTLNDTDADGDFLTITDVTQGSLGNVSIDTANNLVFYQASASGGGADSFTYAISDGRGGTATATVNLVVAAPQNIPPTASQGNANFAVVDSDGKPGEAVQVNGSGSSDPDGTISAYQWSVNGQLVANASGPTPTLQLPDGVNTVTLVVVDNAGASSAPASITYAIQPPNNAAPVVTIEVGSDHIPDSDGQPGEAVPFRGSATDSDGTVATGSFRWSVNGQAVPAADGQATPTLTLANGTNSITLSATDNAGGVGTATVSVTIGEPSALEELPGVVGNENLENTATATDSTCSALLKADPATLTQEQQNLRATCSTLYANVEQNPEEVTQALEQISAEQITTQQKTAISYSSTQMVNLAARLTALRQGTKGVSLAGLNLGGGAGQVPVNALSALGKELLGEGGSSGDDGGGLLDDRLGLFINGSLRFGSKDATARESGFDFDTQGLTIGADYRFTDALVAGLALGYGNSSADFDGNTGSQDSDAYSGSLYGSWYGKRGYVDGIVSLGTVSYDTLRKINLFDGEITDTALGNTDATQWAVGVAGGLDYGKGGLIFGPNLAVNYIRVDIDGFHEKTTGTSGLAMAFEDQSADSLTVKAGAHLNYSFSRKWGVISPQARFDLVREFANDAQKVTVRYANDPVLVSQGGAGNAFVIFTDDPDEYYFLWAVGVAAQFASGFSGFVDYEQTEGLDTITSGELSFGLRYQTRFR